MRGRTATNGTRPSVTIFDVAREAGLSTATVSRVLSQSRTVKPETAPADDHATGPVDIPAP